MALLEADQLHAPVDLFHEFDPIFLLESLHRDLEYGEGHLTQSRKRLIAMNALFKIDLGDGVETELAKEVDQQAGFDPVAGEERHALEGGAAPGVLARQRLNHAGELRIKKIEKRSNRQFGDSAASFGEELPISFERTTIETFDVLNVGFPQQRS